MFGHFLSTVEYLLDKLPRPSKLKYLGAQGYLIKKYYTNFVFETKLPDYYFKEEKHKEIVYKLSFGQVNKFNMSTALHLFNIHLLFCAVYLHLAIIRRQLTVTDWLVHCEVLAETRISNTNPLRKSR